MIKISLGTANFGFDYGINNKAGQLPKGHAHEIMKYALEKGIDTLDTAVAYGSSESVIGEFSQLSNFKVITKVFNPSPEKTFSQESMAQQVKESLGRLNLRAINSLFLHSSNMLLENPKDQEVFDYLLKLKADGTIKKIGVSVYTPQEALKICNNYPIDLIQFPGNILDRRFWESNLVEKLQSKTIEIHVRSIFLQGLLLMNPADVPSKLNRAVKWVQLVKNESIKHSLTPLEFCLSFIHSYPMDKAVIGVNSVEQLEEILNAYEKTKNLKIELPTIDIEENVINPSLWPKS